MYCFIWLCPHCLQLVGLKMFQRLLLRLILRSPWHWWNTLFRDELSRLAYFTWDWSHTLRSRLGNAILDISLSPISPHTWSWSVNFLLVVDIPWLLLPLLTSLAYSPLSQHCYCHRTQYFFVWRFVLAGSKSILVWESASPICSHKTHRSHFPSLGTRATSYGVP
jgi:hypothetical protein